MNHPIPRKMNHSILEAVCPADADYAVLHVKGQTTRYFASGRGPVVLLLLSSLQLQCDWSQAVSQMATSHRVMIPNESINAHEMGGWLEGFIEGTGAAPANIIATRDFLVPVIETSMRGPERIASIVLIVDSALQNDVLRPYATLQVAHVRIPFLLTPEANLTADFSSALVEVSQSL